MSVTSRLCFYLGVLDFHISYLAAVGKPDKHLASCFRIVNSDDFERTSIDRVVSVTLLHAHDL